LIIKSDLNWIYLVFLLMIGYAYKVVLYCQLIIIKLFFFLYEMTFVRNIYNIDI